MRFFYVFIMLMGITFTTPIAFAWNTPDLGDPSISALSPAKEKEYGKLFMAEIEKSALLNRDLIVTEYLKNLGKRLSAYSDDPQQHFNFFAINDPTINAFAGPDGNIGVNTGLISYVKSEDELAAVLSHEIAHVTQKHLARSIAARNQGILPTVAAIAAGVLTGNPEITAGVLTTAVAGNAQAYLNHTRDQEKEADRIGIKTLTRASYNPEAMATLFQRMQDDTYGKTDVRIIFLQTHPSYETRIADAKNRAEIIPKHNTPSNLAFHLIQARITADNLKAPERALKQIEAQLKINKKPEAHYLYALILTKNKKFNVAIKELQALLKNNKNNIIYQLTLAAIEQHSGKIKEALQTLSTAKLYYPNYYPFIMHYSILLLDAKKTKEAVDFLKSYYQDLKNDPHYLFLYARALGENKNYIEAYQMRARAFTQKGQLNDAIIQLEQAKKQKNQTEYSKQSIEAQLKVLEAQIKNEKKKKKKSPI